MNNARDAAYAALRAGAPRPVIAGDAVEAFGARFAAQNGNWARLDSPADIPAWLQARFAPPGGGTLAVATSADDLLAALPWASAPRLRCAPANTRAQASLALTKVGEISAPVHSQFGYHLIQLVEISPQRVVPFDEAKSALIEKLRKDAETRATIEYRNEVSAKGETEFYPENLRSLMGGEDTQAAD